MALSRSRFVLLSGCSGGGKSALTAALAARGHAVVEEPGRRIVAEEAARGGAALPWTDMEAFLRRAVDLSIADLERARDGGGFVFFDRGLIDAASALQSITGEPELQRFAPWYHYDRTVFLAPPWPEIFVADEDRRHGLGEAVAEYERLAIEIPALGYHVVELPRISIEARADFVLATLEDSGRQERARAQPSPRNSG